jgi:hypothetical protein
MGGLQPPCLQSEKVSNFGSVEFTMTILSGGGLYLATRFVEDGSTLVSHSRPLCLPDPIVISGVPGGGLSLSERSILKVFAESHIQTFMQLCEVCS